MTIEQVKDYTVRRVYFDIIDNTDAYPTNWIKTDGIPYWEMIKQGNSNVKGNKEAQVIIDLYKKIIDDRDFLESL